MFILLSLTVFTVFLGSLIKKQDYSKEKILYLIIVGIAIAVVMGLRAPIGVGSRDTEMYVRAFENMQYVDSFRDYANRNLLDNGWLFSEGGFYFTMWIISRITTNPQIFLLLVSSFMIFCVCYFIYKNSQDVAFSILAFLTLGSFTFMMNGMRQSMAMCICLLAYEYVKKKKLIPFLIVVLIAMLFHKTAFVFLVAYFFNFLKNKKSLILYFVASTVFFAFISRFISLYDEITGENYSGKETFDSGGITTILIYFLSIAFAIFVFSKFKEQSDKNSLYATLAGAEIYIARFVTNQMMERVSYFFFLFVIILLPNAINKLNERERTITKIVVGLIAIAIFAYRIKSGAFSNFRFYFQYH